LTFLSYLAVLSAANNADCVQFEPMRVKALRIAQAGPKGIAFRFERLSAFRPKSPSRKASFDTFSACIARASNDLGAYRLDDKFSCCTENKPHNRPWVQIALTL
jgi:hypothetical protein